MRSIFAYWKSVVIGFILLQQSTTFISKMVVFISHHYWKEQLIPLKYRQIDCPTTSRDIAHFHKAFLLKDIVTHG